MRNGFCVPCLFGLEGLCADELKRLRYENVTAENGRVFFSGTMREAIGANINLRTGERVLLVIGQTNANTFDELFEGVKTMPWEDFIPKDGAFPVKGYSLDSKLFSVPDCQRIIKKSIATRLENAYKAKILPETGAKYQIRFSIKHDVAMLCIDTTGAGLHKRGYRPAGCEAPLRETLAAAIVKLSRYKGREKIIDPFCGSGTIPIEAALAALNRAPGLNRSFEAENWRGVDRNMCNALRQEARDCEYRGNYDITGSDIDAGCIDTAKENAARAGVLQHIRFSTADAVKAQYRLEDNQSGIIITNPPYGERVMTHKQAEELYKGFGNAVRCTDKFKMYILSSHTEFERTFGIKAIKKRKLYNGMIKCDLFMYY